MASNVRQLSCDDDYKHYKKTDQMPRSQNNLWKAPVVNESFWTNLNTFVLLGATLAVLLNIAVLKTLYFSLPVPSQSTQPIAWLHPGKGTGRLLQHVEEVLERIGYTTTMQKTVPEAWHLLWSHEYPFNLAEMGTPLRSIKPYQRVNKFPGTSYVTNKELLISHGISTLPKSFKLPNGREEFTEYANANPSLQWMQKSTGHRGITIRRLEDIDFNEKDTFLQEFIDNPFIIDGRKFDIGVYVVMTSVDPLRLYLLDNEILLRFCPTDYEPFDPDVVDKYVVHDDYTPVWEMPSLKNYIVNAKSSVKEAFKAYMNAQGHDFDQLWMNIRNAIQEVYLKSIYKFTAAQSVYPKGIFRELVRVDFIIDSALRLYLMEVNMSPNLSSAHFPANRHLYEEALINFFSLIGLATYQNGKPSPGHLTNVEVGTKLITVHHAQCQSEPCLTSCETEICSLCWRCLTEDDLVELKTSYMEHVNRRNMRRVWPPLQKPNGEMELYQSDVMQNLNRTDTRMVVWFQGMCELNPSWCY